MYQIALTLLYGIGPKKARILLNQLDSIEEIFEASYLHLHQKTGWSKSLLKQMNRSAALTLAEQHYHTLEQLEIQFHFFTDSTYPRRLKQCDDAPILLFSKGDMDLNASKMIAMVGTRNATEYGKSVCEQFVKGFAPHNIIIVSGMAYGIDITVHQLCVNHQVPTIGVLGHGLDRLYPAVHRQTAKRMLHAGGLLTEFLPGTLPDREHFPMRNRIVAGMCDATIVIESKDSGGSLITADLANEYNRDVFAVPGNIGQIHSKGCNQLIAQQKAHLVTAPEDVLRIMQWDNPQHPTNIQPQLFYDISAEQQQIIELLQLHQSLQIDVIAAYAEQSISQLNVNLFHLEMNGLIRALPGKIYRLG